MPKSEPDRRTANIILVALTLLGAWLRLWHLGGKSLWLDEAATVAIVRLPWSRFVHEWWYGAASFQTAHLLLLRAWLSIAPATEMWVRLPSAFFGIVSIPLLYLLARRLLGSVAAALAAAALLAVSPEHVYYSQETRSYAFTIFLLLLSAIFFQRAVEQDSGRDWVWWTIVSTLAVYAHYFAALVLVAQAASIFFREKSAPWKKVVLCGALILALSLPGMTYVLRAPEFSSFSWMPHTSPRTMLHAAMFLGGSGVKFGIVAILWIAGAVAILRTRRGNGQSPGSWRGMLVLLWAVLPMLLLALASLRHPTFVNRYLIFSLPAALMLAAWGMKALPGRHVGFGLVIALWIFSIPTVIKDYTKPREDWRAATTAILGSAQAGDALVFAPGFTRLAFDYYEQRTASPKPGLRFFSPPYYGEGESAVDLERALAENPQQFPHVWMVIVREFGADEPLSETDSMLEAQLRSLFGEPAQHAFQAITVLEFNRRH